MCGPLPCCYCRCCGRTCACCCVCCWTKKVQDFAADGSHATPPLRLRREHFHRRPQVRANKRDQWLSRRIFVIIRCLGVIVLGSACFFNRGTFSGATNSDFCTLFLAIPSLSRMFPQLDGLIICHSRLPALYTPPVKIGWWYVSAAFRAFWYVPFWPRLLVQVGRKLGKTIRTPCKEFDNRVRRTFTQDRQDRHSPNEQKFASEIMTRWTNWKQMWTNIYTVKIGKTWKQIWTNIFALRTGKNKKTMVSLCFILCSALFGVVGFKSMLRAQLG